MTPSDVVSFAGRDWSALEEEKARFWAERKPTMTPAAALAAGEALRHYVLQVRPDWPDEDERTADLAVHIRVAEALRAVPGIRSR